MHVTVMMHFPMSLWEKHSSMKPNSFTLHFVLFGFGISYSELISWVITTFMRVRIFIMQCWTVASPQVSKAIWISFWLEVFSLHYQWLPWHCFLFWVYLIYCTFIYVCSWGKSLSPCLFTLGVGSRFHKESIYWFQALKKKTYIWSCFIIPKIVGIKQIRGYS